MSLTIYNLFVDAVVRYWIMIVADVEEGLEGWDREVLRCAGSFYSDDGLIA